MGSSGVSPAQANAVNQNAGGDARAPRMREQMPPNVAHPTKVQRWTAANGQCQNPIRPAFGIGEDAT